MSVIIRRPQLAEYESWLGLWQQYLDFYQSSDLPARTTEVLWQRMHDSQHVIECYVAQCSDSGKLLGLVHYYPHASTWSVQPACYLEDLLVDSAARGLGVGEKLINAVIKRCEQKSWSSLYWHTQNHNEVARGLYDKLTGGCTEFVKYEMEIEPFNNSETVL